MAIELRVAGPGIDVVRRLEEGQPELVVGRDADSGLCLPDPERSVSRRHLALWVEDGELHFHVLSVVNGIEMPFGEAPPGARGVLPFGQVLKLAEYDLTAAPAGGEPETPANAEDPWAVLERESRERATALAAHAPAEDDPFGDWGFESTFGPAGAGGGPLDAKSLSPGDVMSFFTGLGLPPTSLGTLSEGELQAIGRLVRTLVLGVLDLHESATGVKEDLRSEDRTMVAVKDNNPLKTDWNPETKLRYLFGGHAAGIGFINPERAVRELLVDLVTHNTASGAAIRAAMQAALKEFEPETLKRQLLGEGTKLFESTRAWDAYTRHWAHEGSDLARWAQRMLDKHFTEAYLRESVRIRRGAPRKS